jgi:tetratricopeptide (TPR) repeat protein
MVVELFDKNRDAEKSNNWSLAERLADELIMLDPTNWAAFQRKAFAMERQHKLKDAARVYDAALRHATSDYHRVSLLMNLARIHNKLNTMQESLRYATEALKINPGGENALEIKAIAEEELGMMNESVQTRTEFIKLYPQLWKGWFHRGMVHQKLTNHKLAIHDFETGKNTHSQASQSVASDTRARTEWLLVVGFFCSFDGWSYDIRSW